MVPADENPTDSPVRFEVFLRVRLERIPTLEEELIENKVAKAIGPGGAVVRSWMALDKGEIIRFRLGPYDTGAGVVYVSSGLAPGADGIQRLGLKFLDAPLPATLIPADARPLP